jgi:hypothetical protein
MEDEDSSDDEEDEDEDEDEDDDGEEEEEEDQLHEEEERELSPQSVVEHEWGGDEDFEVAQDSDHGEQHVQNADIESTEIRKRMRVQRGASPGDVAKKRRSLPSHPARLKGKEIAHESDQGSDGDNEMVNTYVPFL